MNNLKKYTEFVNELNSSTWKSAAEKAEENGQNRLRDKFSDKHRNTVKMEKEEEDRERIERLKMEEIRRSEEIEIRKSNDIEFRIIDEYSYDYYLSTYLLSETGDYKWDEVVKIKLVTTGEKWATYEFAFFIDIETLDGGKLDDVDYDTNMLMSYISITPDYDDIIQYSNDNRSRFANKKSTLMFIKTLEKLYVVQDYNRNAKTMANINNTNVTDVENGEFRTFIDEHFGSWAEFKSELNIRKLYDTYL